MPPEFPGTLAKGCLPASQHALPSSASAHLARLSWISSGCRPPPGQSTSHAAVRDRDSACREDRNDSKGPKGVRRVAAGVPGGVPGTSRVQGILDNCMSMCRKRHFPHDLQSGWRLEWQGSVRPEAGTLHHELRSRRASGFSSVRSSAANYLCLPPLSQGYQPQQFR